MIKETRGSTSDELGDDYVIQMLKGAVEPYQAHLSTSIRYGRFNSGEDLATWRNLLGPDVVESTHPWVVLEIVQKFIKAEEKAGKNFTPQDKEALTIASIIHDWGEIIIDGEGVGDVSYGLKTDEVWEKEREVFGKIVNTIDPTYRELIASIYDEISVNSETRLGKIFNACGRVGFMITALRVAQGINGKRINNWKGLVGNVLMNQTEALLAYAKEFPYVQQYLEENKREIGMLMKRLIKGKVPKDRNGIYSFEFGNLKTAYNHFIDVRESWEVSGDGKKNKEDDKDE